MAMGEYVSVSTQRDTEIALLEKERYELKHFPEAEEEELRKIYQVKGLSEATARQVAKEFTERDAFAAHVEAELRLDPEDLTNPWHAAIASAASFFCGAIIPLVVILLPPASIRLPVTFAAVTIALAITGTISAQVGGAHKGRATLRVMIGGLLAMAVTFGIGKLVGGVGL